MRIIEEVKQLCTCRCSNCKSLLEFERKEASWDWAGYCETNSYCSFKCPACNTKVTVNTKEITFHEGRAGG